MIVVVVVVAAAAALSFPSLILRRLPLHSSSTPIPASR
jgi:hypothetical protein